MSTATQRTNAAQAPVGAWPAGGLERVEACPICSGSRRDRLYEGLTDRVLRCAPGEWTLFRCGNCLSAYLDPRPTADSIGLAYQLYFTHEAAPEPSASNGFLLGYLKAGIRNDYLKARFGVTLRPQLPLGRMAAYLFPYRRRRLEWSLRHLAPPRRNAKLLDIGCGNGAFVRFASSLGWDAEGLDPDPKAVTASRKAGISVTVGGFPCTGLPAGQFDAVTLNHVIEHVHDPIVSLREAHRVLKPGGRIWMATPNLDSVGHRLFSGSWLNLDPPRHLVMLNATSLTLACERAGFVEAVLRTPPPDAASVFMASFRILRNQDPLQLKGETLPVSLKWRARWADLKAALMPEMGEELVMIATKPKGND